MNQYSIIVANVGKRVGDTSSTFATEIKKYVNFRYKEIWERFNWGTILPSYTFNITNGTNDYLLPTNFSKPLYCYDNTNSIDLPELSLGDLERRYHQTLGDSGNPLRYAIYDKLNASQVPTGVIEKYIRFHPTPTSTIAILMPYMLTPANMSADTDLPILDCDYEVELGATAEAWRTKRQFQKAADFDLQYEQHIQHMIWNRENQPNKIIQFAPKTYDRNLLY